MMRDWVILVGLILALLGLALGPVKAQEKPDFTPTIDKGLKWLALQQKADGSWGAKGVGSAEWTARAGLALHMGPNTVHEGPYALHLRAATDWFLQTGKEVQNAPNPPMKSRSDLVAQTWALIFLARVYGDVEEAMLRLSLKSVLVKGATNMTARQSPRGGWFAHFPVTKNTAEDLELSVLSMSALMEMRQAGIAVSKFTLTNAMAFFRKSTTAKGGLATGLEANGAPRTGSEQPALTAAVALWMVRQGGANDADVKKWLQFCAKYHRDQEKAEAIDLGFQYHFAPLVYELGDKGWKQLFPKSPAPDHITWTKYRSALFARLQKNQLPDGSWADTPASKTGSIRATALALSILLLDRQPLALTPR